MKTIIQVPISNITLFTTPVAGTHHGGIPLKPSNRYEIDAMFIDVGFRLIGVPFVN